MAASNRKQMANFGHVGDFVQTKDATVDRPKSDDPALLKWDEILGLPVTEGDVITRTTSSPNTTKTLASDLRAVGVVPGATLLVHSSLSALGWTIGGAIAVIDALAESVGSEGTIMMPAFSESAPEPSRWTNPPVPESWWPAIRNEWPPYNPERTPTRSLGVIAELFRTQPGVLRSGHPNDSFAAKGRDAAALLSSQRLDFGRGEHSPLARLYDLDGWVLLLGVDHGSNSSLHLAEYRAQWPGRTTVLEWGGRVVHEGRIESVRIRDLDTNSNDFAQLGAAFEREGGDVRIGRVGLATTRLMRQRPLVDYAIRWIERHRPDAPG